MIAFLDITPKMLTLNIHPTSCLMTQVNPRKTSYFLTVNQVLMRQKHSCETRTPKCSI